MAPSRRWAERGISLGLLIALWWAASLASPPDYIPSPWSAAGAMADLLLGGGLLPHLAASLRRVAVGLALAMAAGLALGVGMRLNPWAAGVSEKWITAGLSVPSLCWAYISLMFFGLAEAGVYFACLFIVLPFVATDVWAGVRGVDPRLLGMARAYGWGRLQVLRHIVLPSLLPHLLSALRYGFGLSWKVVVVAELVGQQDGVGYMFGRAFSLFSMRDVLAWMAWFVAAMIALEALLLRRLEERWTRWRKAVAS